MTLFRFITSLHRYGLKGICDWAKRTWHPSEDSFAGSLRQHFNRHVTPIPGITIIGDLTSHISLSKTLLDLKCSLSEAKVPHQICDTKKPMPDEFVLNRYTDIVTIFQDLKVPGLSRCRLHRIAFWEFDTGFATAHPECIDGSPLLAMSDYCAATLRKQVHPQTKVEYLRYPFHFSTPNLIKHKTIRQKFNIPTDAFMVFFNFDYRSSYYRKNPEGLLQAFLKAFKTSDNAVLVFKTIGSNEKKEAAQKLKNEISRANAESKVIFINDFISNDQLVSLTAACDVYASLHRGEGFGLGVAEAMSLGKPVVVSNCGATCEFCNSDTAELVPCKTVPVRQEEIDHPDYTWVKKWPEPDIHSAALALRRLYDNPDLRRRLGENARKTIREHYSAENFRRSIESLLAE